MATAPTIDLAKLGTQLETLLKTGAESYIKGNTGALAQLGTNFDSNVLKAIFNTTVLAQLPAIAPLAPDADPDHILAVEQTLEARDAQFDLISAAEAQNAALVKQLKDNALSIVTGVMNSVFGLVGATATKAIAAL